MAPQRLQQIEELYHSARDREPSERAAFLAEACHGEKSKRNRSSVFTHQVTSIWLAQNMGWRYLRQVSSRGCHRLYRPLMKRPRNGTGDHSFAFAGTFDAGSVFNPGTARGSCSRNGNGVPIPSTSSSVGSRGGVVGCGPVGENPRRELRWCHVGDRLVGSHARFGFEESRSRKT